MYWNVREQNLELVQLLLKGSVKVLQTTVTYLEATGQNKAVEMLSKQSLALKGMCICI